MSPGKGASTSIMRYLWAAICFVVALLFAVVGWMPLSKLFDEDRYKDSSDGLYLIFGLPFQLVAAALLVTAVWLVWPRKH
jgi:hypothetical protein